MPMFNFTAWLRQKFPRTQRAGKPKRSLRRTTLQLEQLEDRIVPASPTGQFQFSAPTYTVNETGGTQANITVTRTGGSTGTATVQYATSDNSAIGGTDYTPASGTLTFASGVTSRSFTVPVLDDSTAATAEGDETVTLTLSNQTTGTTLGSQSTATMTIHELGLSTPVVPTFSASESTPTGAITGIATFRDLNGVGSAVDAYAATIDWGDGTTPLTTGTVVALGGGNFRVDAPSHTYADDGSETVTVQITHDGVAYTGHVNTNVADQQISTPTITGLPPTASDGVSLGAIANFATFTDPAVPEAAGDYTATIHWGDGTTSVGTVGFVSGNTFQVSAPAHTYTEGLAAGYNVTVTVQHDKLPALTSSPANIVVADLATHIQSITVSKALLTDADAGSTFRVVVTFNEPMDTTPANAPTIGFSQTVDTTLTTPIGSWNAAGTVYTFSYTVANANVTVGPIDVTITGGTDANGNAQNPTATTLASAFSIDTTKPTATTVASPAVIAGGTTSFTLTATYSKAMDVTVFPGVTFSTSTGGTLALLSEDWTNNTTFRAVYSVANTHVTIANITASFNNASDTHANLQGPPSTSNTFRIDTQNPTASIAVNETQITDSNSNVPFTVAVTYSKAMDITPAHFPTIAFSPSVSSTLTFVSGSWDATNTIYTATYNVAAEGTPQTNVQVTVTGGKDTDGNTQTQAVLNNAFSVVGSAPTVVWSVAPLPTGWTTQVSGDFNGDGKTDLAAYYSSTGQWLVSLSTGTGFLAPTAWSTFGTKSGWTSQIVGDFNGATLNGHAVDDIANFYHGQWWVSVPTGLNTFSTSMWSQFGTTSGWTTQVVGDFNGDGQTDIANYYAPNGEWWVSTSTGQSFSTSKWSTFATKNDWTTQIVGDFNGAVSLSGHRIDDIANYYAPNGEWWLSLSNAPATSTFSTVKWATFGPNAGYTTQVVGDFNGDGKDDIANFHASDATWFVSASTGTSFNTTSWGALPVTTGWTSQLMGDFNRDGKADVASFNANTATWYVSFANPAGTGFTTKSWVHHATVGGWNTHLVGDFSGANYPDLADFQDSTQKWSVNA